MPTPLRCLASLLAPLAAATPQATFNETFAGALDPRLLVYSSPTFGAYASGGQFHFDCPAGHVVGSASLYTSFLVGGDFTASITVTAHNLVGGGVMGIGTYHANGLTRVFFRGDAQVDADLWMTPGFGSRSAVASAVATTTLRIRRTSQTLYHEFDQGSGFVTVHSATHANLAVPVGISLFFLQENGNQLANSVAVDDFQITAVTLVCAGNVLPYGTGLQGTGGIVPQLACGCPYPGTLLLVSLDQGVGGGLGVLAFGFAPASTPLLGGVLLVAPPLATVVVLLNGTPGGAGTGAASLTVAVPYLYWLFGTSLYVQGGVFDTQAVQGVSLTGAVELQFRR